MVLLVRDLVCSFVFSCFPPLGCAGNHPPIALKPRVFRVFQTSPINNVVFSRVLREYPALGSDYGSIRVPEKPRSAKTSCTLVFVRARWGWVVLKPRVFLSFCELAGAWLC